MLSRIKLKSLFPLPTILAAVCLVLGGTVSGAHAQTARLNGHVTDPSGAVLPGAEVKVVNTRTDQVEVLHTDQGGRFEAVTLQPSLYAFTVSRTGFKTEQRNGVRLSLDTTTTLDFVLALGASTESVTVIADANLLQPNSPEMSTEITEKEYGNLPLVQNNRLRNPASFVYLAPGVQGNIRLDGNEYTGATNVIAVNGGPIWNTELLIEGLPGGQTRIVGNYTESSPPVDAVNEFKVTTTLLPADYGHTGFAVGSFGIKSGTNLLHGSIFEYFRNTALDAANWFAKNQGAVLTNPPIHQNEFGGTVSGPVILPHLYNGKDKTFFFFSYVGSRFSGATSYGTSTTPTAQELTVNANGYYDFSDLKTPIYDPATTVANPKGSGFVRTAFPGNLIPASRLDPVAKNILAVYPVPKPGATTIGAFEGDEVLKPDTYTAKVDQALTPAQHLSVAFVHTSVPRINIGSAFPIPLASGYHQTVSSYTARVNHTWTLKPNLVNFVNIGYNRFVNPQTPTGTNPNYPGLLGISGLSGGLFPTFSISGYSTFGDITDANKTENDFYYKDQLYWTLGKHSLRFGGEFRAVQYNDYSPATTTGAFTFKTNETGNPQSQSGTGNAFASFLLGQVDSATIAVPFPLYTRKSYAGFFVQDDWKVLPNLTINLGLREEWQNAPKEARNDQSIVSLTTPNPGAGNLPGALIFAGNASYGDGQSTLFKTDYTAVGPRIGFAYELGHKTVIRGGYGIYYSDYLPDLDIYNSGFAASGKFTNTTGSVSPVFTLGSGVPNYTTSQTLTPTALNGTTGSYYGSNVGAMPRTQNYSLSVQRQVTPNTAVEVAYVGDHNTRQVNPNFVNINQVNPSYLSLGSATLTSTATAANLAAIGATLPYAGFSGTVAQALRPFPQYSTLTSLGAKAGASNYNAGQVVLRERLSHGLTASVNYTYSKALGYEYTTLEGNTGTDNSVQNAYNPAADYSLLPQDVRHAFVGNEAYVLPFGTGRWLLHDGKRMDAFVGNWTLSGIERYQSGFPLSLVMSSNALPIFNYYQRPNLVPGIDPSSHTPNSRFNPAKGSNYFNAAAFAAPGNSSFGNAKPTYSNLRNYPVLAEDVQLTKQTQLTEKLAWSFYAQAFNVANRHRFTGIGTAFGASSFGVPNATNAARSLQFGTRFAF
jgi:hypothetical protein